MSEENINLTAPIHAATTLGKAVAAREVFMDGDKETVQQIGDKTHQLEDAIKDITVSGGASTANAVSYNNETSGMTAVNAQGAIDELAAKNKAQDSTIATKADAAEVSEQMQTEQTRVNAELDKKFDKTSIEQTTGDAEDKVMSQKAVTSKLSDLGKNFSKLILPFKVIENDTYLYCVLDSNDVFLFGIKKDGTPIWGNGIPNVIRNYVNTHIFEVKKYIQNIKNEEDKSIEDVNGTIQEITQKNSELSSKIDSFGLSIVKASGYLFKVEDSDGNFLFGVNNEGNFTWGNGIPNVIRDYVNTFYSSIKKQIESLSNDVDKKISTIGSFTVEEGTHALLIKDSAQHVVAGIYKNGRVFINALDAGNLTYLIGEVKRIQKEIGSKSIYSFEPVPYVFGICNMTSSKPRQYITSIYPEAFISTYPCPKVKINGKRKLNLQKPTSGSEVGGSGDVTDFFTNLPIVTKDKWDFSLNGEGIVPFKTSTNYIRVKNNVASGKDIFLLAIGDSTTAQTITNEEGSYEDGWCYPSVCQKLAELDNIDLEKSSNGKVNFKTIGRGGNVNNVSFSYRGETKTLRSFREASGGWATYCWMNYPIRVRIDFNFEAPYYPFGGAEMWYFCGLATKTPYDSDVAGQPFTEWTGSLEQIKEVCTTPAGRYKPDLGSDSSQYSIEAIQRVFNKINGTSANLVVWDGSSEKLTKFNESYNYNLTHPENGFFDVDKARAYTGEHSWTNDNAFSVDKWLERYRTLDDKGNRLTGKADEQVEGSDGKQYKIGSMVTDVNSWDVCTPTHVFICLGINDVITLGDITPKQKETMASIFEKANPNVNIGFGYLRELGSLDPMAWQDVFVSKQENPVGSNTTLQDRYFKNKYSELGDKRLYIPTMYCEGMRGRNTSGKAFDFDTQEYVSLSTDDEVHPSLAAHYGVAYQVLSWCYLTFVPEEDINKIK